MKSLVDVDGNIVCFYDHEHIRYPDSSIQMLKNGVKLENFFDVNKYFVCDCPTDYNEKLINCFSVINDENNNYIVVYDKNKIEEYFKDIDENHLSIIKNIRDELLNKTDKYMMPDRNLPDEMKNKWVEYRQKLRELPETIDLNCPEFPEDPTGFKCVPFENNFVFLKRPTPPE